MTTKILYKVIASLFDTNIKRNSLHVYCRWNILLYLEIVSESFPVLSSEFLSVSVSFENSVNQFRCFITNNAAPRTGLFISLQI